MARTRKSRTKRPPRTAQRRGVSLAPKRRTDLPVVMPGATRFTDDRSEVNARWTPEVLQKDDRLAAIWDTLREGTTNLAPRWGRRRDPGFYALAFLVFAASKQVDVEPWWTETNDADWQGWGFARRPEYNTVYDRFTELEKKAMGAFRAAAREAIHYVDRKSGGMVANDIHMDACEDQTHAQLQHDCRPGDKCPYERERRKPRYAGRRRPKRLANDGKNEDVAELRQRDNEQPPPEADENGMLVGDAEAAEIDPRSGAIRVKVAGHWWLLLDETAGVRAYTKGNKRKFWVGHLSVKTTCHTFGAPVGVLARSASEQEFDIYPDMLAEVEYMTGKKPLRSVGDKGLSVRKVFALNTEQGICSVYPYRRINGEKNRTDTELHDRYGRPFCKHCGRETRFLRFSNGGEKAARMWVKCLTCEKESSVTCNQNYRYLIPLWRDTEAYISLRDAQDEYERVHDLWRDRYRIGADSVSMRPKRKGKDWKQLRCYAALIIEWLKIAYRYGYLNGGRRSKTAGKAYLRERKAAIARWKRDLRDMYMCPPSRRGSEEELARAAEIEARRRSHRASRRRKAPDPPPS